MGLSILVSQLVFRLSVGLSVRPSASTAGTQGAQLTRVKGGMVYPAVAKQLVFKIGFPWTMRTIGLMALVTLIPANIIVRQKPSWKRKDKPQLDMTIFHDASFLMMTGGKSLPFSCFP